MANFLIQPDVQAFLEQTKAQIVDIDSALDKSCYDYVVGALDSEYDVTGWTARSSIPSLVLECMAMRYAGVYYCRQYSEDETNMNNWGGWLLKSVDTMIAGIVSGALGIGQDPLTAGRGPAFYPTDLQDTDGKGQDIKFSMGMLF